MKEYQHFRKVADQVRRAWVLEWAPIPPRVHCGRCGTVLEPGAPFTVTRLDPTAGNARSNLAPECEACTRAGASGRWNNPAPPMMHHGGMLPWWVSAGEPRPPAEPSADLLPW